jgi:hypothetical protein
MCIMMMHVDKLNALNKIPRHIPDELNRVEPSKLQVAYVQRYGYLARSRHNEPFPKLRDINGVEGIFDRNVTEPTDFPHILCVLFSFVVFKSLSADASFIMDDDPRSAAAASLRMTASVCESLSGQRIFERMEHSPDAAGLACRRDLNRFPDSLLSLSHPIRSAQKDIWTRSSGCVPTSEGLIMR